jgi:hypothetical protein
MLSPAQKGGVCVAYAAAFLKSQGHAVLFDVDNCERYDLIVDFKGEGLQKVQVKMGRYRNGIIMANNYSQSSDGIARRYKAREIDRVIVVCPEVPSVIPLPSMYMLPVNEDKFETHLRVEATKNNQAKLVQWAKDFIITR